MHLLTFILLTLIFWFAGNAVLKILFVMIQRGGAIDIMFNWQDRLDKWYDKASRGSKWYKWLHDALGGCQMCTSFWIMPAWFTVYAVFTKLVFGWFITDYVHSFIAKVFVGWVWFIVFWSVGAILGLFALKFRKKDV